MNTGFFFHWWKNLCQFILSGHKQLRSIFKKVKGSTQLDLVPLGKTRVWSTEDQSYYVWEKVWKLIKYKKTQQIFQFIFLMWCEYLISKNQPPKLIGVDSMGVSAPWVNSYLKTIRSSPNIVINLPKYSGMCNEDKSIDVWRGSNT